MMIEIYKIEISVQKVSKTLSGPMGLNRNKLDKKCTIILKPGSKIMIQKFLRGVPKSQHTVHFLVKTRNFPLVRNLI